MNLFGSGGDPHICKLYKETLYMYNVQVVEGGRCEPDRGIGEQRRRRRRRRRR